MPSHKWTTYSGAGALEGGATVLEGGATVLEGGATIPEGGATGENVRLRKEQDSWELRR